MLDGLPSPHPLPPTLLHVVGHPTSHHTLLINKNPVLLQEEIVDETDKFVDNEKTTRVNARLLTMSLPPKLRRVLMAGQLAHTAAAATALALSSTKAEVVAKEGGAPLARSGSGNLEGDGAGGVGPRTSWPLSSAVPHPHKS